MLWSPAKRFDGLQGPERYGSGGQAGAGRGTASDAPARGARQSAVCQGRPSPVGRGTARGGARRRRAGFAGDRLQRPAPVHRSRPAAAFWRSKGRRPISTPTRRITTISSSRARTGFSTSLPARSRSSTCPSRPKAWKSPMSTSWCACAEALEVGERRCGRASRLPNAPSHSDNGWTTDESVSLALALRPQSLTCSPG